MKLNTTVKILSKELKSGTTKEGKEWEMTEYVVVEDIEQYDGSHTETHLCITTSKSVGELEVGGLYECTIFINSNEYNGKYYTKFRITNAKLLTMEDTTQEVAEESKETVNPEVLQDTEVPF